MINIRCHLAIRLDPVFQTIQFPTSIPNLAASLANVDRDTLTLKYEQISIICIIFCIIWTSYL